MFEYLSLNEKEKFVLEVRLRVNLKELVDSEITHSENVIELYSRKFNDVIGIEKIIQREKDDIELLKSINKKYEEWKCIVDGK